ncbi:basic membrane protein A [Sporobacter termitidis DSM 10068]|uniref:Basic membrane protein A n=1 Tax=Sporobacter termitidis DSM 10068 TaxID=1123282 RepID=A0A1M5XR29_9FIRM|nr:BMP family ABC transporter substrate-binding protein [Sporobacter termitidis]SHI01994.1 basic membrane protein A [Sporobacter termitidis DSM 10068]
MRKIFSVLLAVVLVVGLVTIATSCGGSNTAPSPSASASAGASATPSASPSSASGTYELALITDVGNIDDKSFNEASWNGVKAYAEENNITYAYYRPTEDSTAAREETIATAIDKGATVVVCPGYLFEEAIYDVQTKYPDVQFLLLDGQPHPADDATAIKINANVHCILYKEEQAGYLAGYAAVMDGYTKLGFAGGMAVPAVIRYGYGFVQGADAAAAEKGLKKGDVQINYWYAGGFGPTDDIRTKMDGWYTGGTEVVFSCGGGIYNSIVAAAEAAANGKVIGVDVDQSAVSTTIITSAMKELAVSVQQSLKALYDNSKAWPADLSGKTATLGAAEGDVGLPTEGDSWRLKTFTVDQYKALFDKLVSGAIVVNNSSDPKTTPTVNLVTVDYQG